MVPPSYDEVANGSFVSGGDENEVGVVDEHIMKIRREQEEAEVERTAPSTQQHVFHFKSEVDGQSISSATSATAVDVNRDSGSLKSTSSDAMVSTSSNRISLGEGDDLSLDATVNVTSSDGGGLGDEVGLYSIIQIFFRKPSLFYFTLFLKFLS